MVDLRVANRGATPLDIPDPTPLPKVCGSNILVRPIPVQEKIGSILLADDTKDDAEYLTNVGRVICLGDLAFVEPNKNELRFGTNWCKVGDYVVWPKHTGTKISYKGVKCVLLSDDRVLMVIDDPNDINPMMNLVKY